jgi:hypothetical protein
MVAEHVSQLTAVSGHVRACCDASFDATICTASHHAQEGEDMIKRCHTRTQQVPTCPQQTHSLAR